MFVCSASVAPRQDPAGRRLLKLRLLINFPKRNKQTVVQLLNDRLSQPCLSRNNLIVEPTNWVAMIKGSATPPTLGAQGPPMRVVETTTHLGVIQAANLQDTTLPPKLQSHLAHLQRCCV